MIIPDFWYAHKYFTDQGYDIMLNYLRSINILHIAICDNLTNVMRKHSGMRPHDIAILFKIILYKDNDWGTLDLAESLYISQSEISESLNRSKIAKLLSPDKKEVLRISFLEFLIYGLRYVFPAMPGRITRGIVTAHSAKPISSQIIASDDVYVWACNSGNIKGQEIEPLYKNAVSAVKEDEYLYELLALTDVIRTGKIREFKLAVAELEKRIKK